MATGQSFFASDRYSRSKKGRLLFVDGHNSHYTRAFLEHARAHNIIVLCYPAHGTHVYQGLDICVFGPLKRYWSDERDEHERKTGEAVSKRNFLKIYGAAHVRALTEETIRSAFRKTGIWPFNRDVVTPAMMVPAKETSLQAYMPIPLTTPQKIVVDVFDFLHEASQPNTAPTTPPITTTPSPPSTPTCAAGSGHPYSPTTPPQASRSGLPGLREVQQPFHVPARLQATFSRLAQSSAAYLISNSPMRSNTPIPTINPHTISPTKPRYNHLLSNNPENEREVLYQMALREADIREAYYKNELRGHQAGAVLQQM